MTSSTRSPLARLRTYLGLRSLQAGQGTHHQPAAGEPGSRCN